MRVEIVEHQMNLDVPADSVWQQIAHEPRKVGPRTLASSQDERLPAFGSTATNTLHVPHRRYS